MTSVVELNRQQLEKLDKATHTQFAKERTTSQKKTARTQDRGVDAVMKEQ